MSTRVVVGAQWGDEGKGKIIDILASEADVVVRSQGGNNAGHTVQLDNEVYKLHLIPSGILYENTLCLIGPGVAIDPAVILSEIESLQARGHSCENLRIDPRAHVIMPWHILLDKLSEQARGGSEIGTTRKGMGPCYMDKSERIGLRICDLVEPERFSEKAYWVGASKNKTIEMIYDSPAIDIDAIIKEYSAYGQRLKQYVCDTSVLAHNAIKENKAVLFEGAQGTLLDLDMGTYPFVTSSHPVSGGACIGAGIGPTYIDSVLGVAKAYTTRVGKGPFPTELFDEVGNNIREKGGEYGTTTGRPRRCGWLDLVILRHAVRVNGLTEISLNKLDTLSDIGPLKICVSYQAPDGSMTNDFPPSIEDLENYSPVYEELPGFAGDLSACRGFSDLPENAKNYVRRIEELLECKISMVGIGPARSQNIIL